ncbi:hypothetical protein EXIGLDRAFT_228817 [Exidia glandulosa HHB12029]|uniref:Uncharacterized protein n=1 Tax=Exidia glandulosa HHB12029 TaxID=1314781 RepID=A0A165MNS3_EXIGL|nr:hypothetical protein EXIGLDRAFT_228817 [Exidia glandulosa HHB12029]
MRLTRKAASRTSRQLGSGCSQAPFSPGTEIALSPSDELRDSQTLRQRMTAVHVQLATGVETPEACHTTSMGSHALLVLRNIYDANWEQRSSELARALGPPKAGAAHVLTYRPRPATLQSPSRVSGTNDVPLILLQLRVSRISERCRRCLLLQSTLGTLLPLIDRHRGARAALHRRQRCKNRAGATIGCCEGATGCRSPSRCAAPPDHARSPLCTAHHHPSTRGTYAFTRARTHDRRKRRLRRPADPGVGSGDVGLGKNWLLLKPRSCKTLPRSRCLLAFPGSRPFHD